MSDLSRVPKGTVTVCGREFKRLRVRDLATIAEGIYARRKVEAAENAKLAGLDSNDTFDALTEIAKSRISIGDVVNFAFTPHGAIECIVAAGKRDDPKFDESAMDALMEAAYMNGDDVAAEALQLVGVKLKRMEANPNPASATAEGEDGENPPKTKVDPGTAV